MFRFFENLVDPYRGDSGGPVPTRLWPFLLRFLAPFRWVLVLATFFTALGTLIEIGLIWYAGRVVDLLAASSPETFFAEHGVELLLMAGFVLVLRPAVQFVDVALLNQALMPNLGTLVRWRAHRRMLRQSVGFFQADFAGRIASRVMQTAPSMGEAAFQIFDALVYAAVYLIGALILLADTDARLTLPLILWFLAYVAMMAYFTPRVGAASKAFSDARSAITGRIVDSYSNIQTVKLFSHGQREEAYAHEAIEHGRQTFARQMRMVTGMDLGLVVINGFLMAGVVGWAIWLWSEGAAGVGAVAAATALVLRLNAMTGWIMWALSSLFQNLGVIAEGMETIAAPITLNDRPGAKPLVVAGGAIRVTGLRHTYGQAGGGGLDGVDLDIAAGERIGLVGRSGAGKSSLVNLLLRFHDAEAGRIEIDGQDIAGVTQESLRAAIGMVTQDTSLLHRSVRDNIRYGRPDASEAEIAEAARKVAADGFIPDLVDLAGRRGYDALVGERGVKLSGGQRQRIALARVVLKDAPILVLDEATSALDSEVEAAIEESLIDLMEGKTVIAIAHRLSTIARMDRIVVLDAGRVVEIGPHAALIAKGGLYARFWARQSGGFIGMQEAE
ncbi:ABC transporter ATP-binding protein [Pikeienuella piscinae]|uniref:ABC transporter ATP-binding protein n=1 Tax=Pikeienuella piscinae TaxID=2748098 RepID=A0A7L5C3J7_9RHOB|nr:ABC transporter ATP-binding protein [Pikeienuella piscinae]QIE56429.1 ABC transporter ATP-binding protein [Pikeienuella piscinae]